MKQIDVIVQYTVRFPEDDTTKGELYEETEKYFDNHCKSFMLDRMGSQNPEFLGATVLTIIDQTL